jgi:hypothetical protein
VASYSPVFSAPFINYTEEGGAYDFAVPEGFTAVIRQWTTTCSLGATIWALVIQDDLDAPNVTIAYSDITGIAESAALELRVVVPGGGFISIIQQTLGVGGASYVGGYLLRNVAT